MYNVHVHMTTCIIYSSLGKSFLWTLWIFIKKQDIKSLYWSNKISDNTVEIFNYVCSNVTHTYINGTFILWNCKMFYKIYMYMYQYMFYD